VRIGIVGLNFGRHIVAELAEGSARQFVTLAAVCDLDTRKAADLAAKYHVAQLADLDQALADPTLDAIGLFTGPVGRAALIRKIIRAGKHVMTTKPFERDPAAASEVLQEARRLNKVVHLNSPSPFPSADLKQVMQWQKQYDLGRPVACRREVWASYREVADGGWYDDPARCPVAPIFRLGIYLINDMVRLFGPAESVQVMHSRLFTGRPTPDNAQMTVKFRNGVLASIFASFCVDDGQYYSNSMVLNYERGTIYRNTSPQAYGQANRHPELTLARIDGAKHTSIERALPDESTGGYQWHAFQEAVRGRPQPDAITPEQIVAGIQVIDAMARAEQSGSIEPVQ
jgi:predicted dehydrogenase